MTYPFSTLFKEPPSPATMIVALFACVLFYTFALGVYRLTWHPLAQFPGPKLSAATGWYEFYFEIFRKPGKTFAFEIDHMHAQYGPMVRINPHEIHVSDPDFFDTLYAGGNERRDKYPPAAHIQGTPEGVFGTVEHDLHRERRGVLSSYFSKQSVVRDQWLVDEKTELLCHVFREAKRSGEPVNLRLWLLAFATDAFCMHTLGPRGCMDLLKDPEKAVEWRNTILGLVHWIPLVRQFPWIIPTALELPMWMIRAVSKEIASVAAVFKDLAKQAAAAIAERDNLRGEEKLSANVFHTILSNSSSLYEKDVKRMTQQGFSILSASGDTVGRVLTTAMYHLHENPAILQQLKEELGTAMPDPQGEVSLSTLEALPFLTAVLKESLRISAFITSRAPLVAPSQYLRYQKWAIPPKTPVSMTLAKLMLHPTTFPSPQTFSPSRWLDTNPDSQRNHRYFAPFHRGHRNCIGQNLAWAEMYLCLAKLLRRFEFELYDVVRERDIEHYRDLFVGQPRDDSLGVRVKVIAERD